MNELTALHKTIIVCIFLLTIGALQALGRQTESFITVGLLVLGALGLAIGKIESVQKQTNGGQEKLIRVIEEQSRRADERMVQFTQLIASLPPAPAHPTIEGEVKNAEEPVDIQG